MDSKRSCPRIYGDWDGNVSSLARDFDRIPPFNRPLQRWKGSGYEQLLKTSVNTVCLTPCFEESEQCLFALCLYRNARGTKRRLACPNCRSPEKGSCQEALKRDKRSGRIRAKCEERRCWAQAQVINPSRMDFIQGNRCTLIRKGGSTDQPENLEA